MTAYLGPLGNLIPLRGYSKQGVSGGRAVSFSDTMTRRKAFIGRAAPRTWDCEVGVARGPEIARLQWLADYAQPPFVWYSPAAAKGNILPPSTASLVPGTHNGLEGPVVEVAPGLWLKSALANGSGSISLPFRSGFLDPIPLALGVPFTVSAWLRGPASKISVGWRNVAGASISSDTGPTVVAETLTRASRTLTPPTGAVQATLTFDALQVVGPTISLTPAVTPYSPGRGCKRAVVHGLSESLTVTTEETTLSSIQFTVSEVG